MHLFLFEVQSEAGAHEKGDNSRLIEPKWEVSADVAKVGTALRQDKRMIEVVAQCQLLQGRWELHTDERLIEVVSKCQSL